MSAASTLAQPHATASSGRVVRLVRDYLELIKLRISVMIVITAWAGYYLGAQRSNISSLSEELWATLAGVALTSWGASALNQVLERVYDARMVRTAGRPMATRRISLPHGLLVGMSLVVAGGTLLAFTTNLLTAMLALLTVFLYVAIYTPLKRYTTLNTFIGAFPGAMPTLIGWAAARGQIEWPAVALFAILFVWQFPHFMAIAWIYRRDYARAGLKMIPVVEPDGRSTYAHALFYAVLMIPVSLAPVWLHVSGWLYGVTAILLGLAYLAASIRFGGILTAPTEAASLKPAHLLLRTSILYLPLLLTVMMADCIHS